MVGIHCEGGESMSANLKLIVSMTLFGTIGLFVRQIPLSSSMIALVRAVIGTLFLLLFLLAKHQKPSWPDIRRNLKTLIFSGTAMGFNWILLFEAYRYTTVAIATLCYYFSAIFVIIASPLLLKERLTLFKVSCAVIALLGMILVSGVLDGGAAGFNPVGAAFGLGAAVLYASVVLLNKKLKSVESFDTTISQLAVAAIVLLPYVLLTEDMSSLTLSPLGLGTLLTVAILHTGVAYAMYFSSLKEIKAQTVALVSYLDPIVALLLSIFVLGEPISVTGIIGAVLVLGAMASSELLKFPFTTNMKG